MLGGRVRGRCVCNSFRVRCRVRKKLSLQLDSGRKLLHRRTRLRSDRRESGGIGRKVLELHRREGPHWSCQSPQVTSERLRARANWNSRRAVCRSSKTAKRTRTSCLGCQKICIDLGVGCSEFPGKPLVERDLVRCSSLRGRAPHGAAPDPLGRSQTRRYSPWQVRWRWQRAPWHSRELQRSGNCCLLAIGVQIGSRDIRRRLDRRLVPRNHPAIDSRSSFRIEQSLHLGHRQEPEAGGVASAEGSSGAGGKGPQAPSRLNL